MTNPHYNATGSPAVRSKARSDVIRGEYEAIEAGFDSVESAKADLSGDTFTGPVTFNGSVSFATTVTAPTVPSAGDSTTNVATTAFVQSVLGASGSLLPPQSGHAGKALYTNGTSAAWQAVPSPYPSQTGKAGMTLATDGSSAYWSQFGGNLGTALAVMAGVI